jgi:hypothetical protein
VGRMTLMDLRILVAEKAPALAGSEPVGPAPKTAAEARAYKARLLARKNTWEGD